ncbi:hypothetical protein PV328_012171 [Microctonus aethiopoides]|uniref:Uncharacterized protein n=1 Tax=Microctonus aethiopoides TaxID=144406 RepID=A0AA39FGV6_9HYME|nr:hypothetical protein PV328_012171 [Microctonus aethiopoides]
MNTVNCVLSLKDEVGELFMLYLTREEHERAIGDMLYALQLLDKHKNAIAMQLSNFQQSNMIVSDQTPKNLQPLKLIDEGKVFNLLVTEEEANKALEDDAFRMSLLQEYKKKYFNLFIDDNTNEEPANDTPTESGEENVELSLNEKSKKKKRLPKKAQGKTRSCNWRDEETLLLLSSYGQHQNSYDNDDMFSTKPWIKPLSVAGNSVRLANIENDLSASPPCKKKKSDLDEAKINCLEDAIIDKQLKREQKAIYNERKLQIFEKIAESLNK